MEHLPWAVSLKGGGPQRIFIIRFKSFLQKGVWSNLNHWNTSVSVNGVLRSSWRCWNYCLLLILALGKPLLSLSVLPVLDPKIFQDRHCFTLSVVRVSVFVCCIKKNYYNKYRRAWIFICWYFYWSAKTSKWAVFWIELLLLSLFYISHLWQTCFFLHKACCPFPGMCMVIYSFAFTVL